MSKQHKHRSATAIKVYMKYNAMCWCTSVTLASAAEARATHTEICSSNGRYKQTMWCCRDSSWLFATRSATTSCCCSEGCWAARWRSTNCYLIRLLLTQSLCSLVLIYLVSITVWAHESCVVYFLRLCWFLMHDHWWKLDHSNAPQLSHSLL